MCRTQVHIYIGILISRNMIITIIIYLKCHKTITSRSFVLSFLEARSAQYNLCFESSCLLYPGIIVLKYDHQVHSDTRHDGKLQIYIHLSDKVLYQNKLHIHSFSFCVCKRITIRQTKSQTIITYICKRIISYLSTGIIRI